MPKSTYETYWCPAHCCTSNISILIPKSTFETIRVVCLLYCCPLNYLVIDIHHTHTHTQTLQELDHDLVKFQGCIESVGTQFDSHDNRSELKRLRSQIKSKVTATKTGLKDGKKSQNPQSKILIGRQTAQLDKQINRFQQLLDKEKVAVKQYSQPVAGGECWVSQNCQCW